MSARQEPVSKLQIITQNISRLLDVRERFPHSFRMREHGYVIGFKHCYYVLASSCRPSPLPVSVQYITCHCLVTVVSKQSFQRLLPS